MQCSEVKVVHKKKKKKKKKKNVYLTITKTYVQLITK